MAGQSRKHSFLESLTNVLTGMIIAFGLSQLAYHYQLEIQTHIWSGFVWTLSAGSNLVMTIILTIISMLRGYICRRIFNWFHVIDSDRKLEYNLPNAVKSQIFN